MIEQARVDSQMDKDLKGFLSQLPAIIANAREGDEVACFNILQYIKQSVNDGKAPSIPAVEFIRHGISDLSASEKKRLAQGLSILPDEASPERLILGMPNMSIAATKRLSKKLTAKQGRPLNSHELEIEDLQLGAYVARLLEIYTPDPSKDNNDIKETGVEISAYNRSLKMATNKWKSKFRIKLSKRTTESAYSLYKTYLQWGCIDDDGDFIIIDNKKKT